MVDLSPSHVPSLTLIFPSSMIDALKFSQRAKERGEKTLAASSLPLDEMARYYDQWHYLPSIYDEAFDNQFLTLVKQQGVTHFYTPHFLVYRRVQKLIKDYNISLVTSNHYPLKILEKHYQDLTKRCEELQLFIRNINMCCECPPLIIESIIHHSGQIYGQSNESKIAAMIAVFHAAQCGDVIEIGSAWGRSAFVLAFLAHYYTIGNVLCIDPWNVDLASQHESPEELEKGTRILNWEQMFRIFRVHMLSYNYGNFNYIRTTSEDAAKKYAKESFFSSDEFGVTAFTKKISVIHIDGNHDYEQVLKDYRLWRPYIVPGGWIILDDYVWGHGDGPRRVGDLILREEPTSFDQSFTSGSALFLRFKTVN